MKNIFDKKYLDTKVLVTLSLLAVFYIILGQFTIYLTPQFKAVSFEYLPGAIAAILFGPVPALIFAFVADTIGFLVNPRGTYFFGYTLSEMIMCLVYAILLYKKPLNIFRIALARIIILFVVILGLNFVWSSMLYGASASTYFTSARFFKNIIMLPLDSYIIYFFGKLALKIQSGQFRHQF